MLFSNMKKLEKNDSILMTKMHSIQNKITRHCPCISLYFPVLLTVLLTMNYNFSSALPLCLDPVCPFISLYFVVFFCISLYFPVFTCILLYLPVFPCCFTGSEDGLGDSAVSPSGWLQSGQAVSTDIQHC